MLNLKGLTVLTEQLASMRGKAFLKNSIDYNCFLRLAKQEHYEVAMECNFGLQTVSPLFIDFKCHHLQDVYFNGVNAADVVKVYEGTFIQIPEKYLREGPNSFFVRGKNKYYNDGNGLVSFKDDSGKQFLYCQSQPYYGSRIWPIFDQPDLKARFKLTTIYPNDWIIVSNEQASIPKTDLSKAHFQNTISPYKHQLAELFRQEENYSYESFRTTPILPTYNFCLIGGVYKRLECPRKLKGTISMDLYTFDERFQLLKMYAPFIWELVEEGCKFYEQFFGIPFPYRKYEHAALKEYKWGGMENAGIVTLTDRLISQPKPSEHHIGIVAQVVLHELAHMWYGNLVTLKWWQDLWLNESFADFICFLCLDGIKDKLTTYKIETSQIQSNNNKGPGYIEDQMSTTHPIDVKVQNTALAESIFDAITYNKGAAVMLQLYSLIGKQNFKNGIRSYFKELQWSNSELPDLMRHLNKFCPELPITLKQWENQWLKTAGLNYIKLAWDPSNKSKEAKITITQGAVLPQHPTLRTQKLQFGLIKPTGQIDSIEVLLESKAQKEISFDNSAGYSAIFPNFGDLGYIKVLLDEHSQSFLSENLSLIQNELTRFMVWRAYYDMVRDGVIKGEGYVNMIIKSLPRENDLVFQRQLFFVHSTIDSFVPSPHNKPLKRKMFEFLLGLLGSPISQARKMVTFRSIVGFAESKEEVQLLVDWLNGTKLTQIANNQNLCWRVVSYLCHSTELPALTKKQLVEKFTKVYPGTNCNSVSRLLKVLLSQDQAYCQYFTQCSSPDNGFSLEQYSDIASGLTSHFCQQRYYKLLAQTYYKKVVQQSGHKDFDFVINLINKLFKFKKTASGISQQIVKIEASLKEVTNEIATRNLKQILDSIKRKLRCYQLYQ